MIKIKKIIISSNQDPAKKNDNFFQTKYYIIHSITNVVVPHFLFNNVLMQEDQEDLPTEEPEAARSLDERSASGK
jgi:hypothetical protein